jgi:hypothetical protein
MVLFMAFTILKHVFHDWLFTYFLLVYSYGKWDGTAMFVFLEESCNIVWLCGMSLLTLVSCTYLKGNLFVHMKQPSSNLAMMLCVTQ